MTISNQQIESAWELFEAFLRARGDRITQSRRYVLQAAMQRNDHFQPDDLVSELATGQHRVARATVYNTLPLLVAAGLIREIRDSDVHVHYEPVLGKVDHEHLICDKCGAFIEFEDPKLHIHIDRACETNHFEQRTYRVVIFGTCKNCQNKKK